MADSPHSSDVYFDDNFSSGRMMSRGHHFRLQTTLPLDHATSANLSEEFRSPAVAEVQRQTSGASRLVAGNMPASGQRTEHAREGAATSTREGAVQPACLLSSPGC